jgi:hypothetical protein
MSDRYAAEHGIPHGPLCAPTDHVSLVFDGRLLMVHSLHGKSYPAVSGQPLANGTFDYSEARRAMSREGPIPPGRYWIQPSELWTNHWYSLAPRAAWGEHRITIHIFPGTETHGRGGFFIHGGTHGGSAGCINLHSWMDDFARDLQSAMGSSPDCYVRLDVRY